MGSIDPITFSTIGCHSMTEKHESLLDVLAESAGCAFLSDLRNVNSDQQGRLAKKLESIPPEAYPFSVWNDALRYLTGAPEEVTSEAARAQLIDHYVKSEA